MDKFLDFRGRPRVVITGMGAISPIGNSVAESWQSVLEGRSGIGKITQFDASELPCRIAGEVKDFVPREHMDFKEARRMSRGSQLAVAASRMALADAGLSDPVPEPERTGVLIGTGAGGFEQSYAGLRKYVDNDNSMKRVSPFGLASSLPNMPSFHVSQAMQIMGPISCVVAACATGTQSVGEGAELIRRGAADVVLAGGVEGLIHLGALVGFAAMRALSTGFNEDPERASRPFDIDRDGFILSEGAGILVLERLDHALARGAHIRAEFIGHASSADAYHVAIPHPKAEGAMRAMRWSMNDAGITPDQINYINAHGTSTPVNDAMETKAIREVFGVAAEKVAVSSTKSVTGHAMGGAGALETIFCALALQRNILPPTWNYENPDPTCDLDYVPNAPRSAEVNYTICNSFGLGGQNACVILGKYKNGAEVTKLTEKSDEI